MPRWLLMFALVASPVRADDPPRWFPAVTRPRCLWILGLLGAGAGYLLLREDGPKGGEVMGRASTTVDPVLKDKPLFEDRDEISFRFEGFEKEPPTLTLFQRNWRQRTISQQINEMAYNNTQDPELKEKLHRGPGLKVAFEGLVLRKSSEDPERIELMLVGTAGELVLPETVSRTELERGDKITRDIAPIEETLEGLGSGKVSGRLVLRFQPEKGTLQVEEISANLQINILGIEEPDSGRFTSLTGVRGDVTRRPAFALRK